METITIFLRSHGKKKKQLRCSHRKSREGYLKECSNIITAQRLILKDLSGQLTVSKVFCFASNDGGEPEPPLQW